MTFSVQNAVKSLMPRSLLGRAILILLLPLVLAQMVATYIFFDRHWENLTGRLAYGVVGDISLATTIIDRYGDDPVRVQILLALIARHTDMTFELGPLSPLPARSATTGIINNALNRSLQMRLDDNSYVIIDRAPEKLREVRVTTPHGLLRVEIPERRLHSATAGLFLLWMVGSAVFFFAIALLFMRNQIKPVRRLAIAAENFGKGQEVTNFKPEGALEVRRAAQAFLVMRERIQRQIKQRTEMLAGVSHDLRTPLTRMKLQLAMMKPQPGLDELMTDVAEMEQMVQGFLAFARGEGSEGSENVDFVDFIETVVADATRSSSRSILLKASGTCPMTLRPQAMRRCLANLIGNALRYGTRVEVMLEEAETAVFVHVDDDGPGIPEDKREDVLRAFVRLDESRNSDTGGVGLGLTIARDVARGHGGDLLLNASPLGGLRATVRLPR